MIAANCRTSSGDCLADADCRVGIILGREEYIQAAELPLALKGRLSVLVRAEAQLNKLLQNGIFDSKLNVKHSYTMASWPSCLAKK